jgi:glycosyltransferase involved in cell wall biosynthesis
MAIAPDAPPARGIAPVSTNLESSTRLSPGPTQPDALADAAPPRRSLSVFFPCFNDAGTIASMVMEALVVLRGLAAAGGVGTYEVVVVENGSTDYAWDVLDELERLYGPEGVDPNDRGRLRVLRYGQALDYGGALRAGFGACRSDLVFYTDGDGQYDVRELRVLWDALAREEGAGRPADVVMGNKLTRNDPLHRRFISWAYHHSMRRAFGFQVHDVDCDFRLIKRHVLDGITLTQTSGAICLELMTKIQLAGFRTVEVPVHHFHRAYGVSQFFRIGRIARVLVSLARLWWWLRVHHGDGVPSPLPEPLPAGAARPAAAAALPRAA